MMERRVIYISISINYIYTYTLKAKSRGFPFLLESHHHVIIFAPAPDFIRPQMMTGLSSFVIIVIIFGIISGGYPLLWRKMEKKRAIPYLSRPGIFPWGGEKKGNIPPENT